MKNLILIVAVCFSFAFTASANIVEIEKDSLRKSQRIILETETEGVYFHIFWDKLNTVDSETQIIYLEIIEDGLIKPIYQNMFQIMGKLTGYFEYSEMKLTIKSTSDLPKVNVKGFANESIFTFQNQQGISIIDRTITAAEFEATEKKRLRKIKKQK